MLAAALLAAVLEACVSSGARPIEGRWYGARIRDVGPATSRPASSTAPLAAEGATISGLATWYSDSLAGSHTASGVAYDPGRFTAAHRTLPLGTRLRVWRTDRSTPAIEVLVNDRGPFGDARRVLDLSRAAATALGMLRAGVVPVRAEVLEVGRGRGRSASR